MATGDAANRDLTHLSWDEYFMGMAAMAAQRSKQANKVGVVIADTDKRIVGVGYNGMPLQIHDDETPARLQAELLCEAHTNAILFRTVVNLKGCTMYATKFPTKECAKVIIQSKIAELKYLSYGPDHITDYEDIRKLLDDCGVKRVPFKPSRRIVQINFGVYGEVDDGQQRGQQPLPETTP